jgi:hypothetical protein
MFTITDSFIGYAHTRRHQKFSGSDTLELLDKNLKNKPEDWYYRNVSISYVRNDLGHRCKNIRDTDLENYILFVGCSHTEGIGLELEKTYPYLLSQKMNCDYYNLGIGGSGIDVAIHNLTIWLNKIPKKPKHIFFQVPSIHRFCGSIHNIIDLYSIQTEDKSSSEFILTGEAFNYWNTIYKLTMLKVDSFNIPYTEILRETNVLTENQIEFIGIDEARDGHNGIKSHALLAHNLFNKINVPNKQ